MTADKPDDATRPQTVGSRLTAGIAWLVATRWSTQLLNLISNIVLARILLPADFGIVAIALAYTAIVEGLTLLPADQAIIRHRNPLSSLYDTAWSLSFIRGTLIALAMLASANPVAFFMDEERLTAVIAVLALKPLIAGLQNPRFIDFEKNLVFSRYFVLQVGSRIVMAVVTITYALIAKTYWALVIGNLASVAVQVGWSYALSPYRPRPTLSQFRALVDFSAWLWGTSVIRTLNLQSDKFIIGGLLNTSAVGVYHMGTNLAETVVGSITNPLVRALYPTFSLVNDDMTKLRRNVLDASAALVAVTMPIGVGLALVADPFVRLVLGTKWLSAIEILQVLVPFFALSSITTVTDPVVMARGKTKLMFFRACTMFVVRLGAVIPGVLYFGLMGAVYGWALSHLIFVGVQLLLLGKTLNIAPTSPIAQAWRSWVSLVSMGCCVVAVEPVLPPGTDILSLATLLTAKITAGVISYCSTHYVLWMLAGRPRGVETRILKLAGNATRFERARSR